MLMKAILFLSTMVSLFILITFLGRLSSSASIGHSNQEQSGDWWSEFLSDLIHRDVKLSKCSIGFVVTNWTQGSFVKNLNLDYDR